MVLLAESKTAIVFLQPNKTLALEITDTYKGVLDTNNPNQTSLSTILPFKYFSATSLISNSTLVYMYSQINETFMGEITYDTVKNV